MKKFTTIALPTRTKVRYMEHHFGDKTKYTQGRKILLKKQGFGHDFLYFYEYMEFIMS